MALAVAAANTDNLAELKQRFASDCASLQAEKDALTKRISDAQCEKAKADADVVRKENAYWKLQSERMTELKQFAEMSIQKVQ